MEARCRYTMEEMREMLRRLAPIFDVVRLVDPSDTAVLTLEEDDSITRAPYSCFHVWNRDCRCQNCTSQQAAAGSCQRTKYEFIRENVFYVVSQPLTILLREGQAEVVMEIVSHVSDQVMMDRQENGKTLLEQMEEIQEKLYRDDLTQAFNRRYLNEFTFLQRDRGRVSSRVGLILLDLRQFKSVNDTLGHLAGDQILSQAADVLKSHVRSQDAVIRFGGDEFVIILTDCGEEVVLRKIEELRAAMMEVAAADFGYAYTACFEPNQACLSAMLDQADRRMYEEKRS